MSALDSTSLRQALSEIFFAQEDRAENLKYIVPKQGNWYNPQNVEVNKPATWIAYNIKDRVGTIRAFEDTESIEGRMHPVNIVPELVTIELQFVGVKAEQFAISVAHWPHSATVAEAFKQFDGVVRDDKISSIATWFKQEGFNTIYAYNVRVRVYCTNILVSSAEQLTSVSFIREE